MKKLREEQKAILNSYRGRSRESMINALNKGISLIEDAELKEQTEKLIAWLEQRTEDELATFMNSHVMDDDYEAIEDAEDIESIDASQKTGYDKNRHKQTLTMQLQALDGQDFVMTIPIMRGADTDGA